MAHLKRPLGAVLAVMFILVSIVAVLPTGGKGNNPRRGLMQAGEVVLGLNLQELAAISHQSQDSIRNNLTRSGFVILDEHAKVAVKVIGA